MQAWKRKEDYQLKGKSIQVQMHLIMDHSSVHYMKHYL